jgi:hypothetical protein
MYNQYADEQINRFERLQREQQVERERIAKMVGSNHPTIWEQLARRIHGVLSRLTPSASLQKTPAARERA